MRKYLLFIFLNTIIFKAEAQSSALNVADSLYAVGNYTKAIEQYQLIPNKNAKITLQIARSYRGLGNKKEALIAYKNSLEQNTEQPVAATEYGKLLITRREFAGADTIFETLTKKYPDNPEYFYQRGRALKQLERKKDTSRVKKERLKSEKAFSKAVQLDSTHIKALYQLGLHHLSHRDYPIVDKICFKAFESDPDNAEMVNILAQNYHLRGWHLEAITWFEKLIELGQSTPYIHSSLGASYHKKSKYKKAIEQYLILLMLDNEDYGIHHILAELYGKVKNIEKAVYHAKQALYFKDLPLDDIYLTLGKAYQFNKKFEKATQEYQRVLKTDPDNIDMHYNIAVCADNYYEDKKEVVKLYERFIERFKENPKDYRTKFFIDISENRLKKLKEELFLKEGED